MSLEWNPIGALGVASAVVAWSLGALIYSVRPGHAVNRTLAILLALEGTLTSTGLGLIYLTQDPHVAFAAQGVAFVAIGLMFFAYLGFLGTMDAPMTRPLRTRSGRIVLAAGAACFVLASLTFPTYFVAGVYHESYATWEAESGPGGSLLFYSFIAVGLLGLAVATQLLTRASTHASRRRAYAYIVAFGVRDVGFVVTIFLSNVLDILPMGTVLWALVIYLTYWTALTYGILRGQLFDIDLKIKWTLRRGTLVGAFVVVFAVVAEIAQNYASDTFGYIAGGVAAALMLLVIRPLDRVAGRLADKAMPGVGATPEYVAFRKHEIYRQAAADAMRDGVFTPKERALLDGLRRSLEIDDKVADELETQARPAPT